MTSQDPDLHDLTQHTRLDQDELHMQTTDEQVPVNGTQEEVIEIEAVPFQHEDDETFQLRVTYEQALRDANPDLDDETIVIVASMVVKKARYGVNYEDDVEQLIEDLNNKIRAFFSQPEEE